MANEQHKYSKITSEIKGKLRVAYVQGEADSQGFRRTSTIEELSDQYNLSKNTLYKLAQREKWKVEREQFQKNYEEKLDAQRVKDFAIESKKFDTDSINIAKALLARVGQVIRNSQNSSMEEFTPNQLDALAGAAIKTQKFARLAMGENTDNINLNANIQQTDAFRSAMELLDELAEQRRKVNDTAVH
jgi:hypothetical protein